MHGVLVEGYVDHYNNVRLNSATGYITPKDMLAGRQREIHTERDWNLEEARRQRQIPSAAGCVIRFEATVREASPPFLPLQISSPRVARCDRLRRPVLDLS